jgi:hypothetical protein
MSAIRASAPTITVIIVSFVKTAIGTLRDSSLRVNIAKVGTIKVRKQEDTPSLEVVSADPSKRNADRTITPKLALLYRFASIKIPVTINADKKLGSPQKSEKATLEL